MVDEVPFDLALGLDDEAKAGGIAHPPGHEADAEGAEIPDRIEQARTRAQFAQALRGPGQMVGLVGGSAYELAPQVRVRRGKRLRTVERLGTNLADVVD